MLFDGSIDRALSLSKGKLNDNFGQRRIARYT
jgi:hypothetical protein